MTNAVQTAASNDIADAVLTMVEKPTAFSSFLFIELKVKTTGAVARTDGDSTGKIENRFQMTPPWALASTFFAKASSSFLQPDVLG